MCNITCHEEICDGTFKKVRAGKQEREWVGVIVAVFEKPSIGFRIASERYEHDCSSDSGLKCTQHIVGWQTKYGKIVPVPGRYHALERGT